MFSLFSNVDRLLRGHFTRGEDLGAGRIAVPARTLVIVGLVLGAAYGAFMGLYGALRPGYATPLSIVASAVKVPLLFLLTLVVAFPSLYVFSALSDSRLRASDTLRLLLGAIAVNLALLASFGPVTAFFTLSTESYPFMVVLNVLFFAVSGIVGLRFLRRALAHVFPRDHGPRDARELAPRSEPLADLAAQPEAQTFVRPRPAPRDRSRAIFTLWIVIYAVVGAQMGWILRPFVGTPEREFSWFRARESNFFEAFFHALGQLFS